MKKQSLDASVSAQASGAASHGAGEPAVQTDRTAARSGLEPVPLFTVPVIQAPIKPRPNPHADASVAAAHALCASHGIFLNAEEEQRTMADDLLRASAWVYPRASLPRLVNLAALFAWMFLADDRDDHAARVEATAPIPARDFLERFTVDMSPAWGGRFIRNLKDWTASNHHVARHRQAGAVPTEAEYVPLRRLTSALVWFYDLIEYANEEELPASFLGTPVYRSLMESITDATTFTNDLYSAHKEHARGELHNLPTVLRHHHGMTWQEAADVTAVRVHHHLQAFTDACQALPEQATLERRWARGLAECMAGNLAYFRTSHRYATQTGPHPTPVN
ncbi:terpene synthase family protein [Streptomyces sp. NPDC051578]|uniref:terpene synthase family protein n=1 Tax=Streptomyces sp. NPDC051578 TaxID=3365662 RepID=UPI0037A9692B